MNKDVLKNKIINYSTRKWKLFCYISIFLFIIVIAGGGVYLSKFYNFFQNDNISNATEIQEKKDICENCVRRMIDGIISEETNPVLYAAVIDNFPTARPLYGLDKASLVYEAEVEGVTTRFLAIFSEDKDVEKIGPIRSARPYFLDWINEYGAIFLHCGGSPEALALITKYQVNDLDEYYNTAYFWREKSLKAPHNLLTSSALIKKKIEENKTMAKEFFSWKYKDEAPVDSQNLNNKITVKYNSGYAANWEYNSDNNVYERSDLTEKPVEAKNLIIQAVKSEVVDEKLRLHLETIGKGEVMVCLDGVCQNGTWEKTSVSSRTRYYKNTGEEFEFNAGATWIEVADTLAAVEF
ncbi:MAG: DUF3048 domain-containing protein [Patescibacteria group bacterium]|nr:DUF3048 domain-containing protein [Patescibacteria group bacterium]